MLFFLLSITLHHQVFVGDKDVQKHWVVYMERMDHMVEEALRLNVKWSLQELARAINGDGKSSINPLFKVKVILTSQVMYCQDIYSMCIVSLSHPSLPPLSLFLSLSMHAHVLIILQIEFSPSVDEIDGFVVSVPAELISTISCFKRLPERLRGKSRFPVLTSSLTHSLTHSLPSLSFLSQPIHQVVDRDEEVKKIKSAIESGVGRTSTQLTQEYPQRWKE